jgi:hypothetical protein
MSRASALTALAVASFACSAGGEEDGPPGFGTGGTASGVSNGGAPSGGGAPGSGGSALSTGGSNAGLGGSVASGSGGSVASGSGGSVASGSGGTATVGMGGTGGMPSTSGCASGLLLCDDFEAASANGSPDSARWSITHDFNPNFGPTADVALDTTTGHNSSRSLKVVGSTSLREIVGQVAVERLFVRAWYRLSAAPTGGGPVLMGIGGDQNQDIRLRLWAGQVATLNTNAGDGIAPDMATSGNCAACLNVPSNIWFCAEMFVDDATQTATVWIDGNEAASVVNNDGWHNPSTWPTFPAQTLVRLGFWGLQGASATTVWIDDVAVGAERVNCN